MKKRKARWGCVSLLEPLRSERCPGVKENSWTLNCFRDFVLSSLFFLFLSGQRWKCWYLHQNVASKSIRISSRLYQTFICYFILLFRVILIIRFLIKISFVEMYEGIGRSTPSYEWTISRRAISAKRFAHATIGRHYRLESLRDFAQIKWRLWRGRSAFSLMPFRAFAMLKRRQSSESLQPSLGRGYRGDRRRKGTFRAKLCDASTPRTFGPHKGLSLSRYWQTALPRHPSPSSSLLTYTPTPFWTCYVEYSIVSPDRKIFFRPPLVDEGKIRHVARESRYLLCNLCKVGAIPT